MVESLRGKTYEEKLKEIDLDSLEERRRRGDMITCYKMLNGLEDTDSKRFFDLVDPKPMHTAR